MNNLPANFTIRTRRAQSPGDDLDGELARGILDGSKESLERFVDRHLGPLVRFLERRLGPEKRDLAEKLAHLTLRDSLARLKPYASGTARLPMQFWLIRRSEHHVGKVERKGPRGPRRATAAPSSSSERGSRDWLVNVVASLKPREQLIASLAFYEQMDAIEIARAMGVRPARAMRLLRRTLLKINSHIITERVEENQR